MKNPGFILILAVASQLAMAQEAPSFEDILSLSTFSGAEVSPDGQHVIFQQTTTDWEGNRYDRELWISKNGGEPFQLTNNPDGNSTSAQWSPDGQWIGFLSKRGNHTQLHVMRSAGGEALAYTDIDGDISSFEWSPDGSQIAFLRSEDKEKEKKKVSEKYGAFEVDDEEYAQRQLWLIPFEPSRLTEVITPELREDSVWKASRKPVQLIEDSTISIMNFAWSPDGTQIAFDHQPDPLISSFFFRDISVYDLASKSRESVVDNPSYDGLEGWSPDSKSILYSTAPEDTTAIYYKNGLLYRIDLDGRNNKRLAADFDEELYGLQWTPKGIFGTAWEKTRRTIISLDPSNGKVTRIPTAPDRVYALSVTDDGENLAFSGATDDGLSEIYLAAGGVKNAVKVTSSSNQLEGWSVAQSEVISWKSEDGATIEGVLHKPADYDPSKKYPLLVAIHGGPTGISTPAPTPSYVYPIVQWLNKGALVLRPNYRGSAGYGEAFRSLNVKNLGVGDAWDVLSGVDYLEKEGLIDGGKVGCMGWSQGGYISAFLATNSDQFQAISVGAGISNWMTYYVNTDIHPFTRQYLKATPWSDEEIYRKTSPMTNINQASTPTLIQHGEFDRRVPIPNAYELLQGLRDVGVPAKLIVYKGFGHGITKPKERLAATWHNWQWFAKYLWEEEVEIPLD